MRLNRVLCSLLAAGVALGGAATAAVPTQFSSGAAEVRDFVAVTASVGYAATQGGGLWKTSDSGGNWVKTSLPAKYVWKVAFNAASGGARLYAATDAGLFRSTDSGASWTQLTQDATRAVAVSPGSAAGGPDTVLIGVRGVGVLKTTNSGATITRSSTGLDSTDVIGLTYYTGSSTFALAALQCNVEDAPAPLAGNWGGVFRTTDGGASWVNFNGTLPHPDATNAPCVNGVAANGTAGTPIVVVGIKDYSTNQGGTYRISGTASTTWVASISNPSPFGVEFLGPDLSNNQGFFLGSNQFGPYRSTDGGANFGQVFTQVGDPDMWTQSFAAGAFTGTVWMAGIGGIGLFRTTTGSSPWNLPPTPIRADRVADLTNHENVAAGTYYMAIKQGGVMKSQNSGFNWVEFDTGLDRDFANPAGNNNFILSAQAIGAHPSNVNVVALGVRPAGLYQLSGGTSWAMVSGFSQPADHKPQSIVISPAGRVFYSLFDFQNGATPGGLFKSLASGTDIGTLTSAGIPLFDDTNPGAGIGPGALRVRLSPSAPESRMFLVMDDSLPYLSTNGGVNWTRVITSQVGFQQHAFTDIAEKPASAAVVVAATNKGIYRSTNGGVTMSRLNATGLNQHALAALVYHSNNVIFGGDYSGQLYCSGDDGLNWQAVSGGNLGASIKDMKFMNGNVHVLTDGGGFWKKDGVCP